MPEDLDAEIARLLRRSRRQLAFWLLVLAALVVEWAWVLR